MTRVEQTIAEIVITTSICVLVVCVLLLMMILATWLADVAMGAPCCTAGAQRV